MAGVSGALAAGLMNQTAPLPGSLAGQAISTGKPALVTGSRLQAAAAALGADTGPLGGSANVTVPQHAQERPGSAHSVTVRVNSTSMTCAHRGSTDSAPSSGARQDRHSAGGGTSFLSPGSGSRFSPLPW